MYFGSQEAYRRTMKLRSLTLTGAFVAAGLVAVAAPAQAEAADCPVGLVAWNQVRDDCDDDVRLEFAGPAFEENDDQTTTQGARRRLWYMKGSGGNDTYHFAGRLDTWVDPATGTQWRDKVVGEGYIPGAHPVEPGNDPGHDTFVFDGDPVDTDRLDVPTTSFFENGTADTFGPEVVRLTESDDRLGVDGTCSRWSAARRIEAGAGNDHVECNGAFDLLDLGDGSDVAVVRTSTGVVDGGEDVTDGNAIAAAATDIDTLRRLNAKALVSAVRIERDIRAFPITNPRARISPNCHRVVLDNTRSNRKVGFEVALVRGGHRVSHFYHPAGGRTRVVHVRRAVDRIVVWSLDVRQAHRRCS